MRAIEPDVRSNREEFNGRVFVLVMDDLNTHWQRTARVRAAEGGNAPVRRQLNRRDAPASAIEHVVAARLSRA